MKKVICDCCLREMLGKVYEIEERDALSGMVIRHFEICKQCGEALLYFAKNKELMDNVRNHMSLPNRLRFLFKLPLKVKEGEVKQNGA